MSCLFVCLFFLAGPPLPTSKTKKRKKKKTLTLSLSAFTFASAAAFAASSPLIGICAAMPPIACTPRRWQVLISRRE